MTKFGFAVDRGGTFTDIYVKRPDGSGTVLKLLSEDQHYSDAPTEGIRRVLERELNIQIQRNEPIDASHIEWIRMGTTVATNALLERKGEKTALAITKGFKDLLHIGNQSRPNLFDLKIEMPGVLYDEVVEVDERVVVDRDDCQLDQSRDPNVLRGATTTKETVHIWKKVNEQQLAHDLKAILDKGIRSLAVVLLHSYKFKDHELLVEKVAKEVGFTNVSLSSKIMPMIKAVPRGYTATADAYLTPIIKRYVTSFISNFKNLDLSKLLFMQSDGGLASVKSFFGSRAILSGPAGGVVGVALTAPKRVQNKPIIGYDMGGTSTDVSRYDGHFEHVFETTTAGVTIQTPQLNINTVAAGGGSRLFFRDGLFVVGPDSVGANPGPVCYKKGGFLAVTDANLILGRLLPEYFPRIFGPDENEPLDYDAALKSFQQLTEDINTFLANNQTSDLSYTVENVALGFVDVANESMCRPIRALTQAKGLDTTQHVLACFGGAGGQHACAIAKLLGIKTIFVHRYASILSAYGLALADVVHESQEPLLVPYVENNFEMFREKFRRLTEQCRSKLSEDGFSENDMAFEYFLNMRYDRTDCALMCQASIADVAASFLQCFLDNYKREFGFIIPNRTIIVDDIRVRSTGKSSVLEKGTVAEKLQSSNVPPEAEKTVRCFFRGGFYDTNVYNLDQLHYGHEIVGPALIVEKNSTIVIEPFCKARISEDGDVIIDVSSSKLDRKEESSEYVDPVQLSIFSHRFMSIAEQTGRILQRTAISTNIKERLDFSCAVFADDGGLVANAPHIPVHLGSMQETVRFQMKLRENDLKAGDVILCNDPNAGGTHLPDITVITPVYYRNSAKPTFFVGNRGHHADIGGIVPGSMPPHSTRLDQEGACITSFKVVEGGRFNEDGLKELLLAPGKIPGCSGTRNMSDNLADVSAQIAANNKGIMLMTELVDSYGLDVVQKYMRHIQTNADLTVRDMLRKYGQKALKATGHSRLTFTDYMDDGTAIHLAISIDIDKGEAVFDFSGTGAEVYGSSNAPKAVTQAAIIYCLRCLVGYDIPLNQGCLKPITVISPENSIINPSPEAAVVGGNVLTSQRLVDVILGAFDACAASQGCMNNITFGDEHFGYYETVAGGAGAGCGFHGRSGIHTHMTNTRITDPEILEQRYPVILNKFTLRPGSGGQGRWYGGDGTIREYIFRKNLSLSVLCERRAFSPYGKDGGVNGRKGVNLLKYKSGRTVYLGGKASIAVSAMDTFILKTPGGGGWGEANDHVWTIVRSEECQPTRENHA